MNGPRSGVFTVEVPAMNNSPLNLHAAQAALAELRSRGESPKSLALKRRQRVCNFVREFRFAPARHIDMAGCEPGFLDRGTRVKYGLATQLEQEGLLQGFDGGGRFGKLFSLTPKGQDFCFDPGVFRAFDPAKIGDKSVDHVLAVQRFTLEAWGHDFMSGFSVERGHGATRKGSKRHDAIFYCPNDEEWAVEVERNRKKNREFDLFMEACVDHKRNGYNAIVVAFESKSLQNYYKKQFLESAASVRSWSQDVYGDWNWERRGIDPKLWLGVYFTTVDDAWGSFFRPVVPAGFEEVPMPDGLGSEFW